MGRRHFNGLKTAALFGVIWAVLLGIGRLLGGGRRSSSGLRRASACATTAYGYWNSDKLAIRAMRARPVSEVEQPAMYRIVRELSTAGPPADAPAVRLADGGPERLRHRPQPAATPRSAAPRASWTLLDERELRGVLGHELMHVYNRDILTSSVAAAIAGRDHLGRAVRAVLRRRQRPRRGGNPIALLAWRSWRRWRRRSIQLAISRTREYDADEDGARLTGDPLALASALRKLEQGTRRARCRQDRDLVDVSHLMIANPFRGDGMAELFATHPPMAERIARLERWPARGRHHPLLIGAAVGAGLLDTAARTVASAVVDELQRDVEVGALEQGDDGLQVVAALAP